VGPRAYPDTVTNSLPVSVKSNACWRGSKPVITPTELQNGIILTQSYFCGRRTSPSFKIILPPPPEAFSTYSSFHQCVLHGLPVLVAVLPSSTYLFTVGVAGFSFHFITLKHTLQSVGLLWTRDRPVAETSI
jgi:hypothetical protein